MQATPSPRSTSEAPEFFFTTPLDFLATVTDHTPAGTVTGCQLLSGQVPVLAAGRRLWIVGVPGLLARREQLLHIRRDRLAFFLHARDRGFDAGGIPQFERAQSPS